MRGGAFFLCVALFAVAAVSCGKTNFQGMQNPKSALSQSDSFAGKDADASGAFGDTAGGAGGNDSSSGAGGGAGANGAIPKCSTLQKFTFVGIRINSVSYQRDGGTDGQCNTSCHWQKQPADLKTRVGCATRDCGIANNDSLCPRCEYYKEVCE